MLPRASGTRDPTDAERRKLARMWRSVYVPTVVLAVGEGMLVPVLPLYVAALGAPFWLVGLVLAAESVGMLLGDVPAGALLRRVDRKLTMLVGIAVIGFAVAALAFVDGVWPVLLLRLAAGGGTALWGISRHAFLTTSVPPRQRGRALAAFGGAQRIGHLIGPALGGLVAAVGGFDAAFLVYGGVAVVAFSICAIFLAPAPPGPAPRRVVGQASALVGVLRDHGRVLATAGAGQVMAQGIRSGRRIVIPLYAATTLGLDVEGVGWILSIGAAFDVALFPVAGWVMDRFGRKHAIVPSFVLQALGMALVPLTGSFAGLAAATSLIGFGNGLSAGTMMTVGADLAPDEALGEFLGVWRLVGDAGAVGGPVVVGALADLLTLPLATFAIASVGLGAAATFAYGVPETRRPVATV
jgi:MFS family permease